MKLEAEAAKPLRLVFVGAEITLDCGRLIFARRWWRGALWAQPARDVRVEPKELRTLR